MSRETISTRRRNETRDVVFGDRTFSICVGYRPDGRPAEVFADGPKEGSDMRATISDACVLISIALQYGIGRNELERSLGRVPRWVDGNETEGSASIIGAIVEAIEPTEAMPL
jgi:hypothetical protein